MRDKTPLRTLFLLAWLALALIVLTPARVFICGRAVFPATAVPVFDPCSESSTTHAAVAGSPSAVDAAVLPPTGLSILAPVFLIARLALPLRLPSLLALAPLTPPPRTAHQ